MRPGMKKNITEIHLSPEMTNLLVVYACLKFKFPFLHSFQILCTPTFGTIS